MSESGISSFIKLNSNENPLGASLQALLASQQALQKIHLYPDGECHALKSELARFLSVQPHQITPGNGSENLLELIVKSWLRPGDTAVISQYTFLTIPFLLKSYGISAKIVPVQNWQDNIAGMMEAIDEKTRVLFLVNPNNPLGTYTRKTDFFALMESVPPHVLVVVDEAYAEYMMTDDYPDTLACLPRFSNLIITRTFSKAYGLAALRAGYAVSSPDIADRLNRSKLPFNVNSIAATAACAALRDQAHVKKHVSLIQEGRQQLQQGLLRLNLDVIPSVTNFITVNVQNAMRVYQQLLQEDVMVFPLVSYGMPAHIRVSIGTREQNEDFLAALSCRG